MEQICSVCGSPLSKESNQYPIANGAICESCRKKCWSGLSHMELRSPENLRRHIESCKRSRAAIPYFHPTESAGDILYMDSSHKIWRLHSDILPFIFRFSDLWDYSVIGDKLILFVNSEWIDTVEIPHLTPQLQQRCVSLLKTILSSGRLAPTASKAQPPKIQTQPQIQPAPQRNVHLPPASTEVSPLSEKKQPPEGKSRKSMCLLISAILGILYSVYLITYFSGALSGSEGAAALGAGIAVTLVMPHIAATVLATVFTTLGWGANSRGLALTGAILYCVAAVLFPLYAMFVLVQIILAFVGFTRLKTLRMQ